MNPHEELCRERKARAIADQLQVFGCDAASAQWLSDEAWHGFAHLAGHRPPSWRTRELVLALLVEREEVARRYAEIRAERTYCSGCIGIAARLTTDIEQA